MPITNRFKSSSQLRAGTKSATPRDVRRTLDDHETPPTATLALAEFCDLGPKPKIFECAAGSGRIVRALAKGYHGAKISTADIKDGDDFLQRHDNDTFAGAVVTNPPLPCTPFAIWARVFSSTP